MIPYTPSDVFTETDIYDLTDLVRGGLSGESNIPLKALLDRTLYLYNRLARFEGVKSCTGSYSYDAADFRKSFSFLLTDNSAFTLPDVTTLPIGTIIPINTRIGAIKALTVQTVSSQKIQDGVEDTEMMYMHDGERLWLIAAEDHYEVILADGNFYTAGESYAARLQGKNTLIAQGQLVNRADVPRIAKFVSKLTTNQQKVSDVVWLSDPGSKPVYRGLYSEGNGTSTLRLPDERGMFERYLDLGRGIDTDRLHDYPGGYEVDELKSHTHNISEGGDKLLDNVGTFRVPQSNNDFTGLDNDFKLKSTGGTETRPKSIGKLPLIPY